MSSKAKTQQLPAAPAVVLSCRHQSRLQRHGEWLHIGLTCRRDKKVIPTKVLGTVKWFNVRNEYGFINRNDTKEDVFVQQTTIKKNNPRKYLAV
ncbi:hypothetical protein STEG23_005334 [Scotinomys teguina]